MWLLALMALADSVHGFPLVLARAESLQVTVSGAGAAVPVVLIPGLFGSAFAYRNVIPLLTAAGFRAIVVDALGVTRAIVVAQSTGASIAYRLAYRRGDLVRGVVSLEGGPVEAAATPGLRRAMQLAPWIKLFGGVRLIRRKIHKNLIAASGDTSWVSDSVVAGYTGGAARDLDGTLKAFLAMAQAREREPLRPHLAEITCPVALLVGSAPHDGGPRPAE